MFLFFAFWRNSEAENADLLASYLMYLPQLTYENVGIAFEHTANIAGNRKYEAAIDNSSLRRHAFEASIGIWT